MSVSRYLTRYQSRSLMYIRGLIPRNVVELAGAVPIGSVLFTVIKIFTDLRTSLNYENSNLRHLDNHNTPSQAHCITQYGCFILYVKGRECTMHIFVIFTLFYTSFGKKQCSTASGEAIAT